MNDTAGNHSADGALRPASLTGKAGQKLRHGTEVAREKLDAARIKTSEGVSENPLSALIGGAALGALIGALLPSTRREKEYLGKAGRKINETARTVTHAATEEGKAKLEQLGLTRDNARVQADRLIHSAKEIVDTKILKRPGRADD